MRYVFLGLMCVFASIYAAIRDRGSLGARLTVKSIASVSFVMIAFAGRVDAARPYYTLILLGLCLSLAGDVLLVFPGSAALITGGIAFFLAHVGYMAAFFIYAAPAWYDAVLFAAFVAIGVAAFAGRKINLERSKTTIYAYAIVLCAMAAKAVSMMFAQEINPLYAAFAAALGGVLFAFSDLALAHAHFHSDQRIVGVLSTTTYYAAQALIAMSIAL